ncbi:MAG TPA: GH1 family beta-glucosidase [Polyangiaceae bacterium]|nr:GH1 family beta-glucosidase [Polyangiaceae bacterium]
MTDLSRASFGPGFRFGVATSSYQIEGAVNEDGRGPSIWDRFSHTPGKTKFGHHGDVACDHYHRLKEDVALLDWLGVDAYRFSIAWPRVLPNGRGSVNARGLDFYERLVDALLERGIEPCATLYHWDLPDALPGGWLARDTVHAFAEFAAAAAERLGDRVAMWFTHNEPWCQAFLGYQTGLFAPGHRDLGEALTCAHHLLVSHGLATQALRAHVKRPVGIAINLIPAYPATESEADARATARYDGYFNRWFIEPLLGRGYPKDMVELYGAAMPKFPASDVALMGEPIDVLGINYYERAIIAEGDEPPLRVAHVRREGMPRTADREIYPLGLSDTLRRLHQEYGFKKLVVTENGAAFPDEFSSDGRVHDVERVAFFRAHLQQMLKARGEGIPVDAYFAWSLMDNFEWSEGYTLRYGLVHVDFETQVRKPKDSAEFLRSLGRHAGTAREAELFTAT